MNESDFFKRATSTTDTTNSKVCTFNMNDIEEYRKAQVICQRHRVSMASVISNLIKMFNEQATKYEENKTSGEVFNPILSREEYEAWLKTQ